MELIDVVRKLIGPVEPVGETRADDERYENLKALTALVDNLICEVRYVTENKSRHEFSMKRAGEHASKFLRSIGVE